jgi:hypothetical protein
MTLSARSQTPGAVTAALTRYSCLLGRLPWPRWLGVIGRHRRPAGLCAQLGFEPGERLLAAGAAPAGGYALAASDRALYHRGKGETWSRLGWELVSRVGWEPAVGRVVIVGLADGVRARVAVPLRERGHLPEIAAERITHTRLGSWRIVLPSGQPLIVAARRRPATSELLWLVASAGDGPALNAADRRVQVERAVARLADEAGLSWIAGLTLVTGLTWVSGLPR